MAAANEACTVAVQLHPRTFSIEVPAHLCGGACADADVKEWLWLHHKNDFLQQITLDRGQSDGVPMVEVVEKVETMPENRQQPEPVANHELQAQKTNRNLYLLSKIAHVQRQFFQSESPKMVFGFLLEALLDLMDSEYGFIGEVKFDPDGTMFLQTHAITNIAWDQASRQFYDKNIPQGLRFYNMNSLFGAALMTREPVISNSPTSDGRACGIPKGHPPLDFFLGIPFFKPSGELNGMVGIANRRPHGYTTDDIQFLEPFTVTCSNLIQAYGHIAENRYLIDTLEESVQKRTRELELANTDLEAANQQVKQYAATQLEHFACMSHEIRTPLNCIIGMSNLIKDTEMTAMQDESVRMIVASGDLLLAIVNDVLDYAKLETENIEIDVKRSNLQETLNSVIHSIEMKAHSTQSVKSFFDVTIPEYMHVDSRRLQQILFNLLGNAVKFSPLNSVVEFHVQLLICPESSDDGERCPHSLDSAQSDANGVPTTCPFHKSAPLNPVVSNDKPRMMLRFIVKDYGKGIDEKDFDRIFQPFQQAASGKEEVSGGTGLGLAITKKLVSAMGGDISVDSQKGAWSTFTVNLPFVDAPINVPEVALSMKNWSVSLVGVIQTEEDTVTRVLEAYKVDVRKFVAMGDVLSALADVNAMGRGGTHVCLVHEDYFDDAQCDALIAACKATVVTFGPKYSAQAKSIAHHFRSLEQILPSVLMETLSKVQSTRTTKRKITGEPKAATDFESLRILIAEDNVINQKVLCGMLSRLGVKHVDIANNGLKACEQEEVQNPPYDIILMDQQMPVMGGVEACRRIVNRPGGHAKPKVVFVTAHVSPTFEAECREAGGTGFLPKPFKLDQIEGCFHRLRLCS